LGVRPQAREPARDRILGILKIKGPSTSARLAKHLGTTAMAVRQHLAILHEEKLVESTAERGKVGRPALVWRLSDKSHDHFPDRHAEFAVALIETIRSKLGDKVLERLTRERARTQVKSYRARMPDPGEPLARRVAAFVLIRRQEGYMADWMRRGSSFEIVENHCAISQAARVCPVLCDHELSLLRTALGNRVRVDRVRHILSGQRCCAYHITPRSPGARKRAARRPRR